LTGGNIAVKLSFTGRDVKLIQRKLVRRVQQPGRRRVLGVVPVLIAGAIMTNLLGGCTAGADLPDLPPADTGPYRLGAGDEVRTITFGEPQLTGNFRVSDSGTLQFPLIGAVPATGRTVAELQSSIAGELRSRHMLIKPSVSVEVVTYRPIFVLGEVNHPGRYAYEPGMTVLSAVADAGGFTSRAVESVQSVVRTTQVDGATRSIEGRAPRDALLAPGDVVTVFERNF
jgi:polysaccharide export outer membrane protein